MVPPGRRIALWQAQQIILEEEQHGADRAAYGSSLIKSLAPELEPQFGSRFSERQLHLYVQFYCTFRIASAVRTQLSWTHYKTLIGLDNPDKREFHLAEATMNN